MDLAITETPILKIPNLEIGVPAWIEQDISPCDVAAIVQGGCDSGAYMPAVTYHKALKTMSEHGDDILQYIEDQLSDVPPPKKGESWAGIACHYLTIAVELWASSVADELADFEPETETEIEAATNARLIAAAPELLDALREFSAADTVNMAASDYRTGNGDFALLRRAAAKARAIIAKAEGRDL
jgi:hypothetical protein